MKIALGLKMILILSLAISAMAQEKSVQNDVFKEIQQKIRDRKFVDAASQAQRILETPALSSVEKARFLKIAAEANLAQETSESARVAMELQERIIADASITNAAKIEAIKAISEMQIASLAGLELADMNLAEAHATLGRALSLPKLKPEESATAITNIAQLFMREDKHALARGELQKVLSLEITPASRLSTHRLIAETFLREGNEARAIEIYRENKLDLVPLYVMICSPQRLAQECRRVLDDAEASDAVRWNAFRALPGWSVNSLDLTMIREVGEKYLPVLIKQDPTRVSVLLPVIKKCKVDSDHAFILWAGPMVLQIPTLSNVDSASIQMLMIDANWVQGNRTQATQSLRNVLSDVKLSAMAKLWAALVSDALEAQTSASIHTILQNQKDATNKDKADAFLAAARTALRAQRESSARTLYEAYLALLASRPRAQISCTFSNDSPRDIGGWMASKEIQAGEGKAVMDRPYGENIQFLVETDSAMTGRDVAKQSDKVSDNSRTDLQVVCDSEGLYLFLKAYDSQWEDVVAGTCKGGGFEMYIAPGDRQAYYTCLANLPKGDFHPELFVTSYPNAQFRTIAPENENFRSQTRSITGGFVSCLFFSWDAFYDKLPTDGTAWQLEVIRWTRNGGFSFGGSKSVHHRSNWGDIVFANMTKENQQAIKRGIIYKAIAKYRQAKLPVSTVGNWSDPILGDPIFFRQCVAPVLAELDASVVAANQRLTGDDVDRIYAQAVPGWMEIEFRVADMRERYLQDRLVEK